MTDPAVVVDGIGKRYRIGAQAESYQTVRENVMRVVKAPIRNLKRLSGSSRDTTGLFWALREVSFEVEHGEVLGIVGRNGAGKSTLLKILCRVTMPTEGRAVLQGRVGSLLEVATGFHPELTGRENVYLYGAILGMTKREIDRKFDEIVAFAETEEFLDTQVKRYSSGMYTRLAFSVSAHLEPEILLIDEVLAVGDIAFQKKCLGKMSSVAREGRTVLFVSHNMGAVNALCDRAVWIDHGRVVDVGSTGAITEAFALRLRHSEYGEERTGYSLKSSLLEPAPEDDKGIRITDVRLTNPESPNMGPRTGDPLRVEIDYETERDFVSPAFIVRFRDLYGMEIVRLATIPISGYVIEELHRRGRVELLVPMVPFVAGHYLMDVDFVRSGVSPILRLEQIVEFDVEGADYYGTGMLLDRSRGLIVIDHEWDHVSIEDSIETSVSS